MGGVPRLRDWIICLAAAAAGTAVLSLMLTMLLMGLPHGWDAAVSWHNIWLRTGIIATVVVPAALVARVAISVSREISAWHESRRRDHTPPSTSGGGRHR
jgi:magnesium-transporting ATPase (P-type)